MPPKAVSDNPQKNVTMCAKKTLTARRCKLDFMKSLKKLSAGERKDLIAKLSDKAIDDFSEIVYNLINCDFGLSEKRIKNLKHHLKPCQKDLKFISNKQNSINKRRFRLKKQAGSGIGVLLSALGCLWTE